MYRICDGAMLIAASRNGRSAFSLGAEWRVHYHGIGISPKFLDIADHELHIGPEALGSLSGVLNRFRIDVHAYRRRGPHQGSPDGEYAGAAS